MKVFIAAQSATGKPTEGLVESLARIRIEPSRAIPIIAVDAAHERRQILDHSPGVATEQITSETFTLDHFRNERQQSVQGHFPVDGNVLANRLRQATAQWILIDFEQNSPINNTDLIKKLSQYIFMDGHLANCNLVLLVPPLYVGFYARTVNEAFNNLPISTIDIKRSGQMQALLLSTTAERVIRSLPLLTAPMRRLGHLYQWLVKRA